MNITESNTNLPTLQLTPEEEKDVMQLAAVGLMPIEIAASMDWTGERKAAFCVLAEIPGSHISQIILTGQVEGKLAPQVKLQQAAATGNVEAIRELAKMQRRNRYNELITHMDDDEFTG
jgi:hypothetical protein